MKHSPIRNLIMAMSFALTTAAITLPAAVSAGNPSARMEHANGGFGQRRNAQRALRIASEPALAAMMQMRMIERIYLRQGQPDGAERMYRDVLKRTEDTRVRNFANMRLARVVSWEPRKLDESLVELKRGLDENLAKVQ